VYLLQCERALRRHCCGTDERIHRVAPNSHFTSPDTTQLDGRVSSRCERDNYFEASSSYLRLLWKLSDATFTYILHSLLSFNNVIHTGVETAGSGGSMNWGPELLGAPESAAKKNYARKEYALQSPTSALCTSGFQFSPLGPAEGIKGPQVTVEPGPLRALLRNWSLGPFHGAIAVPSVTRCRCRCCRGHRCAGGARQYR